MDIRIPIAAAVLSVSFAAASFAQDAAQAPAGDAKKGQTLYHAIGCWECHGISPLRCISFQRMAHGLQPAFNRQVAHRTEKIRLAAL